MAQHQSIRFVRGNSYTIRASYQINRKAIDITGSFIWMTAKYSKIQPDSEAIFQISTATGDIVIDSASDAKLGDFTIIIPIGATISIPDSQLTPMVYSVVIELPVDSAGKVFRDTVLEGPLTLTRDVTDSTIGS